MAKQGVLHNQSFLDVQLQNAGSFETLIESSVLNRIPIDENLTIGGEVEIDSSKNDEQMLNFYKSKSIIPAFAISSALNEEETVGIGSMIIETNFIVG